MAEDDWSVATNLAEAEDLIRDAEVLPKLSPLLRRRILKEAFTARSRRAAHRAAYVGAAAVCVLAVGLAVLMGYLNASLELPKSRMDRGVATQHSDDSGSAPAGSVPSTQSPRAGDDWRYVEAAADSPVRRLQQLRPRDGQ